LQCFSAFAVEKSPAPGANDGIAGSRCLGMACRQVRRSQHQKNYSQPFRLVGFKILHDVMVWISIQSISNQYAIYLIAYYIGI